ncbi:site-specific integrase [Paenibacillus sp. FSL K6-2524]|uniref:site-specific integrase n=1 Tax=Paenibacillus sp. FSL K6-2524 TaxID=2954516 RepID=UPI0030F6B606
MNNDLDQNRTDINSALLVINEILDERKESVFQIKATNTSKGYKTDWNHFISWCSKNGYDSLPVNDEAYAIYITTLALSGYKTSTITRRMSAISQAHFVAGYCSPKTLTVRMVIAGIRRAYGIKEIGKHPLHVDMLKSILNMLPNNLKGSRDKAILLIGFSGAFRRSEVVAIDVEHLHFNDTGLLIEMRKSITNQKKAGETVVIPYGVCRNTCPVKAVQDWIKNSGIKMGPLFRSINRHGQMYVNRLSDKAISLILKEYVKAAGFNEEFYSSHSLRVGFVVSAAMTGKSEQSIMAHTRLKTDRIISKYIQMAHMIQENGAIDIGL